MTPAELQEHAARILGQAVTDVEYSNVYEDDELSEVSEADQRTIHNLVNSAQIFVTWPTADTEYQVAGPDEDEE